MKSLQDMISNKELERLILFAHSIVKTARAKYCLPKKTCVDEWQKKDLERESNWTNNGNVWESMISHILKIHCTEESIHGSGSTVLSMVSITEKLNWRPESSDSEWNYWGSLCILFLRKAWKHRLFLLPVCDVPEQTWLSRLCWQFIYEKAKDEAREGNGKSHYNLL